MAIKTKSIKVSEGAHRILKTMAAKSDKHVWQVVDTAIALLSIEKIQLLKGKRVAKNGKVKR